MSRQKKKRADGKKHNDSTLLPQYALYPLIDLTSNDTLA